MAKDRRAEEQLTYDQRRTLAELVACGQYDHEDLAERYGVTPNDLVRIASAVNAPKRRIAAAVEEQFKSFSVNKSQ